MIYDFRFTNRETTGYSLSTLALLSIFYFLFSFFSFSQVTTQVDTTKIRIGEQISYKIKVETDSTKLVVFPEGQTFMPLELVETLKIDTIKKGARFNLLRAYTLTQFDSGSYYIPKQKIIIGNRTFFTDSLKIDVNTIVVDTLKQGLFDIKPIIKVEKSWSKWWLYSLIILVILAAIAFLLYWFIWRKKPLTEEEEIALLPPYERAKLALKKLDDSKFLERSEIKEYYSELTFVIRKFLDEKVYDRALESTTEQLIARLDLLTEGNQLRLKKGTIQNIESILKRADLVKFAKSTPDFALAELDKQTIDNEIDAVKETLPEPSEEEKLLNQQYKKQQARKQKRRKIITTTVITIGLMAATYAGFGLKYGFDYVFDTITGNDSKELLEGNWVKSAYGIPPIYLETPQVLKRDTLAIPESLKEKVKRTSFRFLSIKTGLNIEVSTTLFNYSEEEQQQLSTDEGKSQELFAASEMYVKKLENEGARDIAVKREQFSTPNNAQGLKTFGYMKTDNNGDEKSMNYILLLFKAENIRQQVLINWEDYDDYAQQIVDRIMASIELNPSVEKEETK